MDFVAVHTGVHVQVDNIAKGEKRVGISGSDTRGIADG